MVKTTTIEPIQTSLATATINADGSIKSPKITTKAKTLRTTTDMVIVNIKPEGSVTSNKGK